MIDSKHYSYDYIFLAIVTTFSIILTLDRMSVPLSQVIHPYFSQQT